MKAMKIKMKQNCKYSKDICDIDAIYIDSLSTYWKKAKVHDFLKLYPKSIHVNNPPYPSLIPAISLTGEKYVRSESGYTLMDNLLKLPRE